MVKGTQLVRERQGANVQHVNSEHLVKDGCSVCTLPARSGNPTMQGLGSPKSRLCELVGIK